MFTFQSRWKEELVCPAPGGSYVLTPTMGVLLAHLPTEAAWTEKASEWPKDLRPVLHKEQHVWCHPHKAALPIDATVLGVCRPNRITRVSG